MTTTSPITHQVALPDGRSLALDVSAVESTGPAGGPAVLFLASAPGSRRLDPDPDATRAAGIRLITVDRPGYGLSSPIAEGALPSWAAVADDLAVALRELGVDRTAVVGWSNGGIGAMALAARHPDLVGSLAVVATPAPNDEVAWIPPEFVEMIERLRQAPESAVAALTEAMGPVAADAEDGVGSVAAGPADERALAVPGVRARLVAMLEAAFAQGALGMATDVAATNVTPWGFSPSDITAPTTLHYGNADVVVSTAHAGYYAAQIPGSTVELAEGAGHLVVVERWPEILRSVLG